MTKDVPQPLEIEYCSAHGAVKMQNLSPQCCRLYYDNYDAGWARCQFVKMREVVE